MKRQRKSFACPSKYATANEVHLFFLADEECPGVFGGTGWLVGLSTLPHDGAHTKAAEFTLNNWHKDIDTHTYTCLHAGRHILLLCRTLFAL